MAELGCGAYEVYVFERGQTQYVASLPWDSITWGRVVDDTSSASIESTVEDGADCRPDLADVRPWRHEIGVYRDGDVVWAGPILGVRSPYEQYAVEARDLTAWWDHRLIHKDHLFVMPTDLATIFQAVHDDAMEPDRSPNFSIEAHESGVLSTMAIKKNQNQRAGVVLRDLAKSGIDWTTVGRRTIVGGRVVPVQSIGQFTDEHFVEPPTPILDGSQQANRVVTTASGSGSAGASVFAEAVRKRAIRDDGLLEDAQALSTIQDFTAALAASESRVELASQIVAVQDAVLAPDAPFDINDLVAGAPCELRLERTIVPINGFFRLQSVSVSVQASDNVEKVRLAFQPPGAE